MAERMDRLGALGYDAVRQGEEILIFEAALPAGLALWRAADRRLSASTS